jgi:nesprin-1
LGALQTVAAQISEFIGADTSIQIDSDIVDLRNQLSEIASTIEACKSITSNSNKLQASRKVLVAKSNKLIDNVTEDLRQQSTPKDEHQLELLRSHLLNIAVIENDLQSQKAAVNMNDNEGDSFIVNTLDSLQKLFKQTICEYNKLSTQLVHNADNSIIIKIWSDYLAHVDLFLQSPISSDYSVLKEQLHLCKIHQNLIANQRNALMHKISGDTRLVNEFDEFKKRHVSIFNVLYERQREIEARIDAWEKYRKRQANVLEFIDSIEREKSVLNLHQIYLKDIPKTRSHVEDILHKVAEAESCVVAIKDNQSALLNFLDDITLSTLRLEFASTSQRLANTRASLETWLDYLSRIHELNSNYDAHVKNIQDNYQWHLNFLGNTKLEMTGNFEKCKQSLDLLKDKQKQLQTVKPELENLSAIKDEMKDYISLYDTKMIRQTIWVLWQQNNDLNHEYSVLLNQIEERICLQTEFIIRYDNLLFWLNETEGRLMEASAQRFYAGKPTDDGSLSKYYATNILEEFTLKEYDRKWVQSVGNDLILFYKNEQNYDSPEKIDIECKLANLNTKWSTVKSMYNNRSSKVNEIKMTYYNLEARIAQIRAWLFETEKELLKPFVFETATKEAFEKQLVDYEKIQRSVENNSANVAEILNLSEMLLSELISFDIEMSMKNLESAITNIENRWKKLCDSLVARKKALLSLWSNIDEMTTVTNNCKPFLVHCDDLCTDVEEKANGRLNRDMAIRSIKLLDENYEELIQKSPEIHTLERLYNTILTANIDLTNSRNITSESKKVLIIWKTLPNRMTSLKAMLESYIDQYQRYEMLHENIILKLTQLDLDVTNLKHFNNYADGEQQKRFSELKMNHEECEKLINAAEAERRQLMENSNEDERLRLKQMSDEYHKLLNDIRFNIDEMNQQFRQQPNGAVREVEVAVQVNTLESQQSVSPKDAYQYEIQTAIKEFRTSIAKLEDQLGAVDVDNSSGIIPKSVSQKVGKGIAACESSLELIKYLNSLLINDYGCDDDESHTKEIETLYDQFRIQLQIWSEKKEHKKQQFSEHSLESDWRSCPFCSQRNWQQIDNDLWRLEQWLHVAENERRNQQSPPSNIEELEDTIQDHREFLLNLDSHKSIISSLNIVGEHLALHTNDTEKAQQLRKRLAESNQRWEQICQHATTWQLKLQDALIGNREFHKIINEFYTWLEDTERKVKHFEPVDLSSDKSVMESKFMRFKELKSEIERCEPRVISLQENSAQLLKSSGDDRIAKDTFTK